MVEQQFFIRYTPGPTDLMGDFVGHHHSHPLLVGRRGLLGVVQHVGLSVRDEPPVFHGPRNKVRNCYHI